MNSKIFIHLKFSSYDEDLVVTIARLETIFYFEREKSCQKLVRLTFMVLHKLAILAQQVCLYTGI